MEQEAAAWIAKLDAGALSREDLRALRSWALESPRHRSVLEELAVGWDMLDVLVLTRPAERTVTRFGKRWQWSGAALAAGLAGMALAIGLLRMDPAEEIRAVNTTDSSYFTSIGERRTVTLPDASMIRINTNSRLQVVYSERRRDIFLHQGEAFFEVEKSDRPFVVTAGNGQVTAVSTAFAVRISDNNELEVDVTEGTVMVTSGHDTAALEVPPVDRPSLMVSAGQVARVGETIDLVQTVGPAIIERQLAWREGMLVFDGDSLESVIAEISRYTPVEIVIAEPSLRNLKIGGYFRTGDTELLLDTLSSSFGIEVEHIRPGLIYLRPRPD
ncbi:MAG: FecR domain-containing protein [Gammaproteobacteria bacterium]|nr:FecR domain-containing protein [Gammaproteobacteria bacterium]